MRYFVNSSLIKTVLGLILILFVGCAGSPPSRFYLLSPLSKVSETYHSDREPCVSIGIGPVRLPEYTNRPQIVTRTSQNELSRAQFDLWAEPLPDTFSRVLAKNLTQLLCTKNVYLFPWIGSTKPDYIIRAEVMELSGDLETQAFLQVHWSIWGVEEDKVLVQKSSIYSEPVREKSYNALVQAYSNMVGQFSQELAEAVKGL